MRFLLRNGSYRFKLCCPGLAFITPPAGSLCVEIDPDWGLEPISRGGDSSSEATVVKAGWRKRHSDEATRKSFYTGTNGSFSSVVPGVWRLATTAAGMGVACGQRSVSGMGVLRTRPGHLVARMQCAAGGFAPFELQDRTDSDLRRNN